MSQDKVTNKKKLLTEKDVIDDGYPFTLSWLRSMRVKGGGIPFIKAGARIFYRPEDIDNYITSKRVTSTTEAQHVASQA